MSGTLNFAQIVVALQELIKASYLTQETLAQGLTVNTTLPATTVAALPATAPAGAMRYATNGRNTGEGAGAGTGCIVVGNGTIWRSVQSGTQVLA